MGITSVLFALTYLVFGWYSDAYQSLLDYAITGEYTGYFPKTGAGFPEYMGGAWEFFPWLGSIYPIRWMAFFLESLLFISMWVIYYQVLKQTAKLAWLQRLSLILLLSIFFVESVALYHMVRIAMFLGIAGITKLLEDEFSSKRFLPLNVLPYLLLFTIGCWVRYNVLLFVIVFMIAVVVIHRRSVKPLLPFLAVLLFFGTFNSTFLNKSRMNHLHFYFAYDAEFKLLFAGNYQPEVRLQNHTDSVKFEALTQEFYSDNVNLGRAFYERIGIFDNFRRFSSYTLDYAIQNFIDAMRANIYYLLIDLVLLLFYMIGGAGELKNYRLKTLALFTAFYGIVFLICFLKMENRFLVPFQICFLLTILFIHQPALFYSPKSSKFLLACLLLWVPLTVYYTYVKVDEEQVYNVAYKKAFNGLVKQFGNGTFVIQEILPLNSRPYETFKYRTQFNKLYFYNYRTMPISPPYQPYLEHECNCSTDSFAPFYDYLYEKCQPVVLLDRPSRIRTLQKYLADVYNRNYIFKEVPMETDVHDNLRQLLGIDSIATYTIEKKISEQPVTPL